MSTEPRWLTEAEVRMLHAEALRLFGGSPGVRDAGLLQSALGRPQNRFAYEEGVDLFALAAAYAFGIARNHAFVDGNERTALLDVRTFLFLNGYRFVPGQVDAVTMTEGVAAGEVDEVAFTAWIAEHTAPR